MPFVKSCENKTNKFNKLLTDRKCIYCRGMCGLEQADRILGKRGSAVLFFEPKKKPLSLSNKMTSEQTLDMDDAFLQPCLYFKELQLYSPRNVTLYCYIS